MRKQRKKKCKLFTLGNEGSIGISSPFPKSRGSSDNLNGASDVLTVKEGRIFLNGLPRALYACLTRTEHSVCFKAHQGAEADKLHITVNVSLITSSPSLSAQHGNG